MSLGKVVTHCAVIQILNEMEKLSNYSCKISSLYRPGGKKSYFKDAFKYSIPFLSVPPEKLPKYTSSSSE